MKCQETKCDKHAEFEKVIFHHGIEIKVYLCKSHFRFFYNWLEQEYAIRHAKLAPEILN